MTWRCFLVEPTGECRRQLRRYSDRTCPADGFNGKCDATSAPLPNGPVIWHESGRYYTTEPPEWPRDDPRWPQACASCGQSFAETDTWQLWYERLYRIPAEHGGGECTIRDMPIGAMWRADWFEDTSWVGPDGRCYAVQLPPGGISDQWVIEQPSSSGGHWTRTGEPPLITASPSILTPRYHGFLQGGILTDDLEGRRYE
jgi:hypothetical protein